MNSKDIISLFADLVTLLYHEGRNVRHLIKSGKLSDDTKFRTLGDGLAKNRYYAWKQVQPLRHQARKVGSGKEVERLFEHRFKLTLDDLIILYDHPGWKGTLYGGNAWLPIARRIKEVSDLLNSGREEKANYLMGQVLEMSHNTGKVSEKLNDLDDY